MIDGGAEGDHRDEIHDDSLETAIAELIIHAKGLVASIVALATESRRLSDEIEQHQRRHENSGDDR